MEKNSYEKLKADATDILNNVSKLRALKKHFDTVEANTDKRTQELDLKEKNLEKEVKALEEEKAELRTKTNQLAERLESSVRIQREIDSREKQLKQVMDEIESRDIQLKQVMTELKKCISEACKVQDETDRKKKALVVIVSKIEKSKTLLATVDKKLDSHKKVLESKSLELVSKGKELVCVKETIKLSSSDLEKKQQTVQSLNNRITQKNNEIELKGKQLKEAMEKIERLCSEARNVQQQTASNSKDLVLLLERIRESSKQFVTVDEQLDSRQRLLEVLSLEVVSKEEELGRLNESINNLEFIGRYHAPAISTSPVNSTSAYQSQLQKSKFIVGPYPHQNAEAEESRKQLMVLNEKLESRRREIQRQSVELVFKENELARCCSEVSKTLKRQKEIDDETARKSRDLVVIVSKIEESSKLLMAVNEQLVGHKSLLESKGNDLVMEKIEGLCSEALEVQKCKKEAEELVAKEKRRNETDEELKVKEKRLNVINNLIKITTQQLDLKSRELRQVEKPIEEQRNEDSLKDSESIVTFTREEVSDVLRALPNPREFVLDFVEKDIRHGLDLKHLLLENMVVMFGELGKIQQTDENQIQLKATEVATVWKERAPKSSIESLAFLLFLMAFGIKSLINQEEALLLVSSIPRYRRAPTLLKSLGLKLETIPKVVKDLINRNEYIPAVRLICLFKLTKDFAPTLLLLKEINIVRQSSQAKDKDASGRLRAILELVADYNLKISIPGDLVARLIIQRKPSTTLARCTSSRGS